jgi:hypothetical protein
MKNERGSQPIKPIDVNVIRNPGTTQWMSKVSHSRTPRRTGTGK